jgi:hypothetical protein
MKRIAAVIATAFALLAIPATAMASTSSTGAGTGNPWSGSGSGYVNPGGPILKGCRLPHGIPVSGSVQVSGNGGVQVPGSGPVTWTVPPGNFGKPHRFRCRLPRPVPPSQVCTSGTVAFNMPPNGYFFTEYSGPQLYSGEQFNYSGTTYTISTVSGAVFSLDQSGSPYQNGGQSVPSGTATVSCAGLPVGS